MSNDFLSADVLRSLIVCFCSKIKKKSNKNKIKNANKVVHVIQENPGVHS